MKKTDVYGQKETNDDELVKTLLAISLVSKKLAESLKVKRTTKEKENAKRIIVYC